MVEIYSCRLVISYAVCGTLMNIKSNLFAWMLVLSSVFVAVILFVIFYLDIQHYVVDLLDWVQSAEPWSEISFIVIYLLLTMFLVPTILFTLGSGFLFGTIMGGAYVLIAVAIGGLSAFLLSRYFFANRVRAYLIRHEKFRFVNDELVSHGWRAILILRLIPFFPLKLSNYFLGVTQFSVKDFLLGTVIGIIPNTLLITYAGSLAADITLLASGQLFRSPLMWASTILGFIILLIFVLYIIRLAKLAIKQLDPKDKLNQLQD